MDTDTNSIAVKEVVELARWELPRTPDDGPPDAVETMTSWYTLGGVPITDADHIAVLEAKAAAQAQHQEG